MFRLRSSPILLALLRSLRTSPRDRLLLSTLRTRSLHRPAIGSISKANARHCTLRKDFHNSPTYNDASVDHSKPSNGVDARPVTQRGSTVKRGPGRPQKTAPETTKLLEDLTSSDLLSQKSKPHPRTGPRTAPRAVRKVSKAYSASELGKEELDYKVLQAKQLDAPDAPEDITTPDECQRPGANNNVGEGAGAKATRGKQAALKGEDEWVPKTGKLYKPANTGFPEADRIAKVILDGYGGDVLSPANAKGDIRRVHVVRKELCDNIIERLRPSLENHIGCDIIDLNPGPGVFSSAIHDLLKPRTHILMDPDPEIYNPFLQPLLASPGSTYKLVPKSGIVWGHLQSIMNPEFLPHQEILPPGDPRLEQPNNTLLLVANLGYYPKKSYRGFPSISKLVQYQLLNAARAHSLVHKYGLVRMLIWMPDDEKHSILPKSVVSRKKGAVQAEITCSEIAEIASSTHLTYMGRREHSIDLESSLSAIENMNRAGVITPEGREHPVHLEALKLQTSVEAVRDQKSTVNWSYLPELEALEAQYKAGKFKRFTYTPEDIAERQRKYIKDLWTPEFKRHQFLVDNRLKKKKAGKPWNGKLATELEVSDARFADGQYSKFIIPESEFPNTLLRPSVVHHTPKYARLRQLRNRSIVASNRTTKLDSLIQQHDEIIEMQKKILDLDPAEASKPAEETERRIRDYKEAVRQLGGENLDQFYVRLDNRKLFYQDPPVLYWDRRKVEPLRVKADEFFPRHELALLDFQPQPLWPLFRENFPANYDTFEYIINYCYFNSQQSTRQALLGVYPGALEHIEAECPSLKDPRRGGNADLDLLSVRALSHDMWKEIMEAWMRWPFKPSRFELMRRLGHHQGYDDEDEEEEIK